MSRSNSGPPRVLITDDETDVRRMLAVLMSSEGFDSLEAENGKKALSIIRQGMVDIMLLDLEMPDMTGLDVLREVRQLDRDLPIVLISGFATMDAAIVAGKYGVNGFLTKPFKNDEVILAVQMAMGRQDSKGKGYLFCSPLDCELPLREAMGPSPAIQKVLDQIELVAPTTFTVVICGETGVGKEVIATTVHRLSPRAAGPLIAVDCGSIPPTLIESELFGHVKGAFTGADHPRTGSFEAAAGGTLFLDEIGNLPLTMQAKLLRALQERRIYRVGSTTPIQLDVRVLAATNEDLGEMVAAGQFRRDLYYRLSEFNLRIPPLRERQDDILFLAQRFLQWTSTELHKDIRDITDTGKEMLLAYPWPGNVRELRNVIRRAVLLARGDIGPEHLGMAGMFLQDETVALADSSAEGPVSFKEIVRQRLAQVEREVLEDTLKQTQGNMKKAAHLLNLDYKTLRTKAKQYRL